MMRLPLGLNTRLPHEGCFSLQINAGLCAEMRFIKGILFSKTQFQNHYINELVLRFRDWLFFHSFLFPRVRSQPLVMAVSGATVTSPNEPTMEPQAARPTAKPEAMASLARMPGFFCTTS